MGSIAGGKGQLYGWMWAVYNEVRQGGNPNACIYTLACAFICTFACMCTFTLARMCICTLACTCICTLADFCIFRIANMSSCPHLHSSYASFYTLKTSSHFSFTSLETRPDTRPSVLDRWAGAEMQLSATKNVLERLFSHLSTRADGPTDNPTDGRMDRRTDRKSL